MFSPLVGVVMGSKSDLSAMSLAFEVLEELKIEYKFDILSAHRTADFLSGYGRLAEEEGLVAIIAGAGGAAHLPGMLAAWTILPVIGVPILSTVAFGGLDSLLSIVQMPDGVPVGTQAMNGAKNAGIYAAQIVATKRPDVRERLRKMREESVKAVVSANERLHTLGWREYLREREGKK